jgi:hypothetical protein
MPISITIARPATFSFTRVRPYRKDDNAHIEQKNWTHVRRLLGYERNDSPTALETLNDLHSQELRLFQNLFLPTVKLRRKIRVGSKPSGSVIRPKIPSNECEPPSRPTLPKSLSSNYARTRWPFEFSTCDGTRD